MSDLEIYGTLGPSCHDQEIITKLFEVGMTGIRLNLSHCNLWDKKDWLDAYHQASQHLSFKPDLLIDMKGPELRLGDMDEIVYFPKGSTVVFSSIYWPKEIVSALQEGDDILYDDGKLEFHVKEIRDVFIHCVVSRRGYMYSRKSIAIKGKSITGPTLQDLDIQNLLRAKEYGVTGLMQPFVRSASDLIEVRKILNENNLSDLKVYAKIENLEGVHHLEEIIPLANHIVIARGDLGNAVGLVKLPIIQKQIEDTCKKYHKPYMVVTEMLASMIENEVPTRAEVSDIFHAVYNGASSIMLTGETANGKHPIEAMTYFVNTALEAKKCKEA